VITFGPANQETAVYKRGHSPLREGVRCCLKSESKGIYYLKFSKMSESEFRVIIENEGISLTVNQDLERVTSYENNDFNRAIDNIKGEFRDKLLKYLDLMWDFGYALNMLIENLKRM